MEHFRYVKCDGRRQDLAEAIRLSIPSVSQHVGGDMSRIDGSLKQESSDHE